MSQLIPLFIILGLLVLILIVAIIFAMWDWRKWLMRRFGPNYRHGLASVKLGNVWVARESELYYEGDDAMSYVRKLDAPGPAGETITVDILPSDHWIVNKDGKSELVKGIGFEYHEGSGRRQYRMQPGGSIATALNNDAPITDYPSELISIHTEDRAVSKYIQTVSGKKASNAAAWALGIILAVVLIGGGIYLSSRGSPAPAPASSGNSTVPAPAPSGPKLEMSNGAQGGN